MKPTSVIFFTVFIFLITGCPERPKHPESVKVEERQYKTPVKLTPLQKLEKRLLSIQSQLQPHKNKSLLDILQKAHSLIYSEEIQLNDKYQQEYNFYQQLLEQIDNTKLSQIQKNDYLLYYSYYFILHENYHKAEILLSEPFDQLSSAQFLLFLNLQAKLEQFHNRPWHAVQFLTRHYILNPDRKMDDENYELNKIWSLVSVLPAAGLAELEDIIIDNNIDPEMSYQLIGWQQLAFIFKNHLDVYSIYQEILKWRVQYPQHIAPKQFIDKIAQLQSDNIISAKKIAILLPLSGKLKKLSEHILDGIVAAHFHKAHDLESILRIYDTSTGDINTVYNQAINDNVDFVIGPLQKKLINQLTPVDNMIQLNLNQISNQDINKNLYYFALNPDDEVIQLADKAWSDGHRNVLILAPLTKWGKRMANTFKNRWMKHAETHLLSTHYFDQNSYDFKKTITSMLTISESVQRKQNLDYKIAMPIEFTPRVRQDIDFIFLASGPKQGKQIPLQIAYNYGVNIPIYTTSNIIEKPFDIQHNQDLNGIIYADMPWMISYDESNISHSSKLPYAQQQRLFSFGVDAYALIPYLGMLANKQLNYLKGETGLLSISSNNRIDRKISFAQIQQGKSILLKESETNIKSASNEDVQTNR